jgi:hypothetical protein
MTALTLPCVRSASPPVEARFYPETHTYTYHDRVIPSVTQILNEIGFIDFSRVPRETLLAAQQRGTYVHQVLHAILEDDFDFPDDCEEEYRGYVESGLAYLADVGKHPLRDADGRPCAVEWRFWHPTRYYGGTCDYVGWDRDGVLSLDDWKSGEPSDVCAPLQLAAYEAGVRACLLPQLDQPYHGEIRRRAVKLYRDGTPGRPEPYRDPRDLSVFFSALSCVHYRRNHLRHEGGPHVH